MLKRFIASAALTLLCGAAATQTPETSVREERGNLILDGVPAPDPALMEQVDQYTANRGATLQGFLSDGGILIRLLFYDWQRSECQWSGNPDDHQYKQKLVDARAEVFSRRVS